MKRSGRCSLLAGSPTPTPAFDESLTGPQRVPCQHSVKHRSEGQQQASDRKDGKQSYSRQRDVVGGRTVDDAGDTELVV